MGRKRSRFGDNPLRGWFRTTKGQIVRVLCWDNYEPVETGGDTPRSWMILRKSYQYGVHLKNYELWYPEWLDELATELLAGKTVLIG